MTYDDTRVGDQLFSCPAGVSYIGSRVIVIDKQEPDAIVLKRLGVMPYEIMNKVEFELCHYQRLTAQIIAEDLEAHQSNDFYVREGPILP